MNLKERLWSLSFEEKVEKILSMVEITKELKKQRELDRAANKQELEEEPLRLPPS